MKLVRGIPWLIVVWVFAGPSAVVIEHFSWVMDSGELSLYEVLIRNANPDGFERVFIWLPILVVKHLVTLAAAATLLAVPWWSMNDMFERGEIAGLALVLVLGIFPIMGILFGGLGEHNPWAVIVTHINSSTRTAKPTEGEKKEIPVCGSSRHRYLSEKLRYPSSLPCKTEEPVRILRTDGTSYWTAKVRVH